MRAAARIFLLLVAMLALAALARANTATVCVERVCRQVETGVVGQDGSSAPPKSVAKRRVFDKKFLFVAGLNVGVSVARTLKLNKCRADHGIGPCVDGGYGEYRAREVLAQTLTGITVLLSLKIKSIEDENGDKHKFWWAPQVFNTAWNASGMVRNQFHDFPPREREALR